VPELPEVETTRRGIAPHVTKRRVLKVIVRQPNLRWPVTPSLVAELPGHVIDKVERRGKYLLLKTRIGTLLAHLGMSGSLRVLNTNKSPNKHDHVDIIFEGDRLLRYSDPRRFGCILWEPNPIESHPLLQSLGPEPLGDGFDGEYLYHNSRKRVASVKTFIMDARVVVGIGNIYANEALFMAGINPKRAAGKVSRLRYRALADRIKEVLSKSIKVGGTTLRDFTNSSGNPGYFKQSLQVYGRGGMACQKCQRPLSQIRLGQRNTVYCPNCQK